MPGGSEVASLFVTVGADTDRFERGMRGVQSTAAGVGNTLRNLALAAGAALGGAAVIDAALGFDRSMANIRAVTGRTAEEMAALQSEILKIGASSTVGPQAVADAFNDIVGGVEDASTHMAILDAAIATSEAGQADLTATTSGLIAVMNAYGFEADKAMTVSDVFTRTVGVGVGTMDEFVSAMSPIAGQMASAGVEFDDLGTMMAFMTTKGVGASMAATQLRQATIALLNPNERMRTVLRRLGIESGAAAIKQFGLAGVLGQVQNAVGGSVDEMARMMGSVEALNAALIINQPGFEDFMGTFEDGLAGATEAARALQLDSVSAQFDRFKSNLEGLAITVGTALMPVLGTIAQFGVDALNAIVTKGPEIVAGIIDWFGNTQIGQDIEAAAERLQPHIQRFGDLIGQAINGMFAGGTELYPDDWLPMYKITESGFEEVPPDLGIKIGVFFSKFVPAIIESATGIIDTLMAEIGRIGGKVVESLTTFIDGLEIPQPIKDVIDTILMPLQDAFQKLSDINWNNIVIAAGVMGTVAAGIKGLGFALSTIKNILIFDAIVSGLDAIDRIVAALKNKNVEELLRGLGDALVAFGGAVALANLPGVFNKIKDAIGMKGGAGAVGGSGLLGSLGLLGLEIGILFELMEQPWVQEGLSAWEGVFQNLHEMVSYWTGQIIDKIDAAESAIRDFMTTVSDPTFLRMVNEGLPYTVTPTITNPTAPTIQPELGITNPFPTIPAPPRDSGGPVIGGRAYRVGVPELFIPSNSGTAVPLSQLSVGGGGGGVTIPVTVTLDGKVLYSAVVKQDQLANRKTFR
jgi:TP901 family phage tail tape measure protein